MVLWVPFGSADSELEGVHASAVVLQLLVPVLDNVKAIDLVFVADIQT